MESVPECIPLPLRYLFHPCKYREMKLAQKICFPFLCDLLCSVIHISAKSFLYFNSLARFSLINFTIFLYSCAKYYSSCLFVFVSS
jgi:hypothetical protein